MGGALAMHLGQKYKDEDIPLLLVAPAWKAFGLEPKVSQNTLIFHGDQDNLVPLKESQLLVDKNSNVALEVREDDHRLKKYVPEIVAKVEDYAKEVGKPTPSPRRLQGYNAILSPSGFMWLPHNQYLSSMKDELFIDTDNKVITKIRKVYVPKLVTPPKRKAVISKTLAPNKKPVVSEPPIDIRNIKKVVSEK
jgi:hypothetical protein